MHLNIKIFGRVQGVFFRYFSQLKAKELGITGFVRNEADGTVYIEAEGEKKALEQFLKWCENGPQSAKVEKIESSPADIRNFSDFIIK